MFRASNEAEIVPPSVRRPAGHPGRSPRYAASFPGLEISEGGEFTVYKKGGAPAQTQIMPKNPISSATYEYKWSTANLPRCRRRCPDQQSGICLKFVRDLPPFPARSGGPDADPCSAGQLWRPRKAPSCGTGRGNGQREVTIRCDGGSPLSSTIILLVQRYLCSSTSSPVAAPV
jgi:hypothetical protein